MEPSLLLGHALGLTDTPHGDVTVRSDDLLRPHLDSPAFRQWLRNTYGLTYPAPERSTRLLPSEDVLLAPEELARHLLVVGATGFGKSFFLRSLIRQTVQQPGSTLVIDPKGHLVEQLLTDLAAEDFPPERLVVLDPTPSAFSPTWNPLEVTEPEQTARLIGELVTLFRRSMETWGPRMADILTNTLFSLAERDLTLYELRPFLTDDEYRERLLAQPVRRHLLDPLTAAEVRDFWTDEFARFSSGERTAAVNPVLNKIRDLVRQPYLRRLVCAQESTLDFTEILEGEQVLLVNLNATELGEEATRLLASLLIAKIYRTAAARSAHGHPPATLVIDELALFTTFAGDSAREILETARGFGLRLVLACQHLAQMSERTLTSVLANTYTQVYFNLGEEDARAVAPSLRGGSEDRLRSLELALAQPVRFVTWQKPLRSPRGLPLKIHPQGLFRWFLQLGWREHAEAARSGRKVVLPGQVLPDLARAAQLAGFYVQEEEGELVPVTEYLREGDVRVVLAPPRPYLEGVFPEARVVRQEKWTEGALHRGASHLLTHLPRREAVVRRKGTEPIRMRSLEVREPEVPAEAVSDLLEQSLQHVGRPVAAVDAELEARRQAVQDRGNLPARAPQEPEEAKPAGKRKKPAAEKKAPPPRVAARPRASPEETLLPLVEEDNSLE